MASQVVMPKMSDTMEEGVVVKWLKHEGEPVQLGEALAEIETDKAVLELEADTPGLLRKILVQEDDKVAVGQLIAVIGAAEEDITPLVGKPSIPSAMSASPSTPASADASMPPHAEAPSELPARAPQEATTRERIDASPLARRMAEEAGLDIAQVRGTGPGGRVVKRDVETFLMHRQPQPMAQAGPVIAPQPAGAAPPPRLPEVTSAASRRAADYAEQDLSMMRQAIARRMVQSKTTVPHFYLTTAIDMEPAIDLRHALNALVEDDARVSVTDMILKAAANALRQFPRLNVSYSDDKIRLHQGVHISVAVALEDGLITPVIRDCDRKSLGEVARTMRDLAERARARRLRPEEYTGGTFSVSNLGMYDVDECAAIINPPEAAILAVGRMQQQPVVVDDQVTVRHRMKVTLSCDHRVVDGATAAQFLQVLKSLLEHPLKLML
jgi:pyruvate dehydrogenase E2 component (dihydrolipoamide acetyltransferase)